MAIGLTLMMGAMLVGGIEPGVDSTRARAAGAGGPADSTRSTITVSTTKPATVTTAVRADEINETRRLLAAQLAGRAVATAAPTRAVAGGPRLAANLRGAAALPGTRANRLLAESPAVAGSLVPAAPSFRRLTNGRLLADSIVVLKGARRMTLFYRGDSVAVYLVALGKQPVGRKAERGDDRTPEGRYYIDARNESSEFHRSLHVSYPSAEDRARAAERGVDPGGDIMIHGLPPAFALVGDDHRLYDWTKGCIALTNREIEEVYAAVALGAVIDIRP